MVYLQQEPGHLQSPQVEQQLQVPEPAPQFHYSQQERIPLRLVTVKVYVPAVSNEIVELVPEPVVVVPPGDFVSVQVPVAGKPFKITMPVATAQVGWVIVPTVGAVGASGWILITTLADAGEIHPEELVTVKVYVPAVSNEIVELVPVPVVVVPPGDFVSVQVPVAGNPFKTTLPVAKVQVGCEIVPTV